MKKAPLKEPYLLDRITINPQIMVGKPIIKGTRITVQHILGLLAQGAKYDDILSDYPHITQEDIYACLLFAQQAIEALLKHHAASLENNFVVLTNQTIRIVKSKAHSGDFTYGQGIKPQVQ